MPSTRSVPAEEDWRWARGPSDPTDARSPHSLRRPHIHKLTGLSAGCLAIGFLACIMLWALDPGPDLWPSGAEYFSVESDGLWLTSVVLYGASAILTAIWVFVITAGAHVVLRHRARSALGADSPHISSLAFSLAEPWDPTQIDPELGHIILR